MRGLPSYAEHSSRPRAETGRSVLRRPVPLSELEGQEAAERVRTSTWMCAIGVLSGRPRLQHALQGPQAGHTDWESTNIDSYRLLREVEGGA